MRELRRLAAVLGLMLAIACSGDGCGRGDLTGDQIARNNAGVGQMGRYDFAAAADTFAALAQERPDVADLRINHAIALMNRRAEGDEPAAEAILREIVEDDESPVRARYALGLLLLHGGRPEEALPHFESVADEQPRDPYPTYFAAQCQLELGRSAEALERYQRVTSLDSRFRSAWYGAFLTLQRLGRAAEARPMLDRFEALERNPQAIVAEFKYTRMGPLGEAVTLDAAPPERVESPRGPRFREPAPLVTAGTWQWSSAEHPASITAADIDGNGRLDVFVAGALAGDTGGGNAVVLSHDDGSWTLEEGHPLAGVPSVVAAAWADFDNDGLVDVFLSRGRAPAQLWRQEPRGTWREVVGATAAVRAGADIVDGVMIDADHDGDLDVWLVNRAGPDELLNNNGDGTFRGIGAEAGIAGDGRPSRGVLFTDLDGDRDADAMVIKATPPHDVFLNDRVWTYRQAPGMDRLRRASFSVALAGDADADGTPEIYTAGGDGIVRWIERNGEWESTRLADAGADDVRQLAWADTDGDGAFELLVARRSGWQVLTVTPGAPQAEPLFTAPVDGLGGALPTVLTTNGPSVVALPRSGPPQIWHPGTGRHQFVTIALTGADATSDQRRSNVSGVGARVAVRAESRWSAYESLRQHSGPGQSDQPVAVGLGGARQADFIAITWSDGVYQTEVALAPGVAHRIEEQQRQLSSCPVLFAFDGRGFAFVTDLLGVGGIGFFERPGVYGEPYPQENILLPAALLQPKDGRYQLKIAEPMEEAAYLDAAWLTVHDVPPGWRMTLDERKALVPPMPSGEPRFYRREWLPVRAVNDRGEDVTAAVRDADFTAAPPGAADPRFIGLTAEHAVTMEFEEPIDGHGRLLLLADGWIEYPYAQTIFAAWQARAPYRAPTLEARGRDGVWRVVLREFGYPAGMPRQMSVPIDRLPGGTRALRLSTSQEIYWDRLAVAVPERAETVRTRLPLLAASLRESGFARRTTGPQRRPEYDYQTRAPLWDTRHQRGFYTAFGSVMELVADADGAVAILGPGEEVHLEFDAAAVPPLRTGWTRRFVLETRGWAKDMDLYTKDGETIAPVPGADSPARRRLHEKYNTRYDSGR